MAASYALITSHQRTLKVNSGDPIPPLYPGERVSAVSTVDGDPTMADRDWLRTYVAPLLLGAERR